MAASKQGQRVGRRMVAWYCPAGARGHCCLRGRPRNCEPGLVVEGGSGRRQAAESSAMFAATACGLLRTEFVPAPAGTQGGGSEQAS